MTLLASTRSAGVASTSYSQLIPSRPPSQRSRSFGVGRLRVAAAAAETAADAEQQPRNPDVAGRPDRSIAKRELLSWVEGTKRGSRTTALLRGQIEEAQVAVEAFTPEELDYSLLEGLWRLEYTTALDVTPIVGFDLPDVAGLPPPLTVGGVFQRFSSVEAGIVENIIEFSVPFLLEQHKGVTFTVEASYDVRSPHRIAITFNQAEVGQLRISPLLEALIAPAVLPRGSLQHQILLGLKEFKLTFPFRSAQQVVRGAGTSASYLLTYLDESMLIGRGPQGTFIFTRVEDETARNSSTV